MPAPTKRPVQPETHAETMRRMEAQHVYDLKLAKSYRHKQQRGSGTKPAAGQQKRSNQ